MNVAAIVVSVPLIAEFVFAPFNLWSGRTMDNFLRFTGLPARVATHLVAPVNLATAAVLAVGLAVRGASIAGAVLTIAVSGFYLVRLAAAGRRDASGLVGFGVFGALGLALLLIRLLA